MDCDHNNNFYCNFNLLIVKDFLASIESEDSDTSTMNNFICFLCKKNIIKDKVLCKYLIIRSFENLYPKNKYHKTNTVFELAELFGLHENTIWATLKYNEFADSLKNMRKFEQALKNKKIERLIKEDTFND